MVPVTKIRPKINIVNPLCLSRLSLALFTSDASWTCNTASPGCFYLTKEKPLAIRELKQCQSGEGKARCKNEEAEGSRVGGKEGWDEQGTGITGCGG